MTRTFRSIFSIVIAVAMVFTTLPMGVFAAEDNTLTPGQSGTITGFENGGDLGAIDVSLGTTEAEAIAEFPATVSATVALDGDETATPATTGGEISVDIPVSGWSIVTEAYDANREYIFVYQANLDLPDSLTLATDAPMIGVNVGGVVVEVKTTVLNGGSDALVFNGQQLTLNGSNFTTQMGNNEADLDGTTKTWCVDNTTKTLYLKNFEFTTSAETALSITSNATIKLIDGSTNSITSTYGGTSDTSGILVGNFNLEISGGGELTVTGGDTAGTDKKSSGINFDAVSKQLTIDNTTVNANGGTSSTGSNAGSYGIYASGNTVVINDSTVNAIANASSSNGYARGIGGGVEINGDSEVTATAIVGSTGMAQGIFGAIKMNGGTLTAIGNNRAFSNQPTTLPASYTCWTSNSTTDPGGAGSSVYTHSSYCFVKIVAGTGTATEPTALISAIEAISGLTATWDDTTSTVTVTGTVTSTTALDLTIPADVTVDWQADLTVSGTARVIGIDAASGANSHFNVTGGSIISTYNPTPTGTANAIYDNSYNTDITVSGGTITAGGGTNSTAIRNYGTITVTGGTINGGSGSGGSIGITAYETGGNTSTVKMEGGTVFGGTGGTAFGINVPASSSLEITGGVVVATSGYAIGATATSTVSVSDDAVIFYKENPIYPTTLTIDPSVLVIEWYGDDATYDKDSTSDLDVNPAGATAKWDVVGGKSGVSYDYNGNTGFIEINGVTVNGGTGGNIYLTGDMGTLVFDGTTLKNANGDTLTPDSTWSISNNALNLSNFNYTTNAFRALYIKGTAARINLIGNNTIKATNTQQSYGLQSSVPIAVGGNGKLTITADVCALTVDIAAISGVTIKGGRTVGADETLVWYQGYYLLESAVTDGMEPGEMINHVATYAVIYGPNYDPNAPDPTNPTNPTNPSPSGSSSSGGGSGTQDRTPAPNPWLEQDPAKTMSAQKGNIANGFMRTKSTSQYGVRKASFAEMKGLRFEHDTVADGAVQVRLYINDTSKFKHDTLVSGYVSGTWVEMTKSKFEKHFENKIQIVHFDQQTDWDAPVRVAAKVNLAGMDSNSLYFYSYDKATNTYKRIQAPEYRIDKNGYLHFTTPFAGDIIISENPLEKR